MKTKTTRTTTRARRGKGAGADDREKLAALLRDGVTALGLDVPPPAQARLVEFVQLLDKWNQTYNLTAVRDPQQMVTRHILDALAVLPWVQGARLLDIGTGPGLPGIPLALARPEMECVLLDSNAKKLHFVTQALGELGIKNVTVAHERVEKYHPQQKFDTLTARAFASLAELLASAGHLANEGARFLAMKGVYPQEELNALPPGFVAREIVPLSVPGLEATRHLVVMTRQ